MLNYLSNEPLGRPAYQQTVRAIIKDLRKKGDLQHVGRGNYRLNPLTRDPRIGKSVLPFAARIAIPTDSLIPEEISDTKKYYEGAVRRILVNAYERDHEARKRCIEHYGTRCWICKFSFAEMYGSPGEDFIHVHHLVPLSEIGEGYEVDPILEMRPLCPNCHAMVHRRRKPYTLEEVRQFINSNKK